MRTYCIVKLDTFGSHKHGVLCFDHTMRPYDPNFPLDCNPLLFTDSACADYYARNIMQNFGEFHIIRIG